MPPSGRIDGSPIGRMLRHAARKAKDNVVLHGQRNTVAGGTVTETIDTRRSTSKLQRSNVHGPQGKSRRKHGATRNHD